MKEVEVTIGFCVKNVEDTVKEAVESIINQHFPHELMEVIVVDGFSTDRTLSIIKESLSKTHIQSCVFRENSGLTVARNIVINNAHGNYIIWVDGDMVLSNDFVRKQVEFMGQNRNVGIAGGKFEPWPGENLIATLESAEWMAMDCETERKATSKPSRHFCGGTIYRVEAIRQIGGFDEQAEAGEDLDAEYRICEAGWLVYFVTDTVFHDRRRTTWRSVWKENSWYGYGMHYLFHKYKNLARGRISPNNLFRGLRSCFLAYESTGRKVVFLLLLQYFFKKLAWYHGFLKGHLEGYGHFMSN